MKRKTMLLLAGLLLMALAVVGIGYGLWFEVLQIEGTVETGEVDVAYSPTYTYEWFANGANEPVAMELLPPDWGNDVGYAYDMLCDVLGEDYCTDGYLHDALAPGLFEIKDNVECVAVLSRSDDPSLNNVTDAEEGDNVLTVTVSGAYPSYHCLVIFDITSNGTVPVHLSDWEVTYPDGANYEEAGWVDVPYCEPVDTAGYFDPDGPNGDLLPTEIIQLHQGESAACRMMLHFTNETMANGEINPEGGDILEDTTYQFNFRIIAKQWNESGVPLP